MENLLIEKLVFGGQALARKNGKIYFVWGALPGEEVEVDMVVNKKTYAEAITSKVIKESIERVLPLEAHYQACSPWQIISHDGERFWKKMIAEETFKKIGAWQLDSGIDLVEDNNYYHYRNKVEYGFTRDEQGELSLALNKRESHRLIPVISCALVKGEIEKAALNILLWLKQNKIKADDVRELLVRCNQQGHTLASLIVKKRISWEKDLTLESGLIGFSIYLDDYQQRNNLFVEKFFSTGADSLKETLDEIILEYGINSFFQVNVPIFARALLDIKQFISKGDDLVDYYSGVGAIGLSLSNQAEHIYLIESNQEAVSFCKKNIQINNIKNCEAIIGESETLVDYIDDKKVVILDPPRAGLNKKIIQRILSVLPKRIIYLSCNISTQARDVGLLKDRYALVFIKLYNFFPRTPHFESLCVLDKK